MVRPAARRASRGSPPPLCRARHTGSDLVTRAGIAGIVAGLATFFLLRPVLEHLPGVRAWGCAAFALAMLLVPAAAVIAWALYGF
jgi:hypothetical protein